MSPTIFRDGPYRYFFFSREEDRMHVHVTCSDGEAKFWLEPIVCLAQNSGLSPKELTRLQKTIEERKHEIKRRWQKHHRS